VPQIEAVLITKVWIEMNGTCSSVEDKAALEIAFSPVRQPLGEHHGKARESSSIAGRECGVPDISASS
jgi:hypothetical protein